MAIVLEERQYLRTQLPAPFFGVTFLVKQLDLHDCIVLTPGIGDILEQSDGPFQSLHPQSYFKLVIDQEGRDEHALQFILELLQGSVDVGEVLELVFDLIVPHLVQCPA